MLNRIIPFLFSSISFLMPTWTFATQTNEKAFIENLFGMAPRSVLPLLDKTSRLDLIDLFNSRITAKCENLYGGQTEMLEKDANTILLRTSPVGTWKMVVLTAPSDTIIMMLHDVSANGTSTEIKFYNKLWQPLTNSQIHFPHPNRNSLLLIPNDADENLKQSIINAAAHRTIQAEWNQATNTLKFSLNLDSADKETKSLLTGVLCSHNYKWQAINEKSFDFIEE